MPRKIIIIGGSLSGAAAAARIRSLDHQAEIILLEKGATITYSGTAWPGLLLDDSATPRGQHTMTAEEFQRQYRVDVRVNTEVTAIHRLRRLVEVRQASDLNGSRYKEKYDYLILAVGSLPVWPKVFPEGLDGLVSLKTPSDALQIRHYLQKPTCRKVIVAGAGATGIQTADVLLRRGLDVTLTEQTNHILPGLDPDLARVLENRLSQKGINLQLSHQASQVDRQNDQLIISFSGQDSLAADLVILACGSRPDSALARKSGLKTGFADSVQVNNNGQTSDKRIFAIGAMTESLSMVSGQPNWQHSMSSVVRQARQTADFLCGRKVVPQGNLGLVHLSLPGLEAACAGAGENQLLALHVPFCRCYIVDPDENGECFMIVKTLWSTQNRRILGAQLVGGSPSAEKLTGLALAIQTRQTADDLARLELPFDCVRPGRRNWLSLAGQMAVNRLDGLILDYSIYDLTALDTGRVTLLDVRDKVEYLAGAIPGAISLPLADLIEGLSTGKTDLIPAGKPIYLYSGTGRKGYLAARQLLMAGKSSVLNLAGGYWLYREVFGSRP